MTLDSEDRLSDLPRNVIDQILELLPPQDAARTSILSRKWRYVWAMLPYLALDYYFFYDLPVQSQTFFKQTVDEILMLHVGDVVKFVLCIPYELLSSHADIDRWLLYVSRNGVKELTLSAIDNDCTYELPSHIFNCQTLTSLVLKNCYFTTPISFLGFQNLTFLQLQDVTLTSYKCLSFPVLVHLDLISCDDTDNLKIVSPRLESILVHDIHHRLLNSFVNCQNLKEIHFVKLFGEDKLVADLSHDERMTLEKFFLSLAPLLEKLYLDAFSLELLTADTFLKWPPFALNRVWNLSLVVDFSNMTQVSGALQLIKSIPNLSKLQIMVHGTGTEIEAVSEYLSSPACLEEPLDKLKHVVVIWFEGSKNELIFLKLLFARTPSLVIMRIMHEETLRSREVKKIIKRLRRCPKASSKAKLSWSPDDGKGFR